MSEADKYRAFARDCMRWAQRAQISIEHRKALLDMATAWADAAVRLDHHFALIEQFDDLTRAAMKNLRAAADGDGQAVEGNGRGQAKQTDGLGRTDDLGATNDPGGMQQQSAGYDPSAK